METVITVCCLRAPLTPAAFFYPYSKKMVISLNSRKPVNLYLGIDVQVKRPCSYFVLDETFPSASYRLLETREHPPVTINFNAFRPGPKDMLDACMCAFAVHQYLHGIGTAVGGEDGLRAIILPVKPTVPDSHPILHWPN